ncbi:tyrosine-protein kinase Btk29A isoform X2 [Oratosquilla oratoria]|uniref:tyrosine-protein kinase Btk29A isoform X2 n=1 Tax=Oratosquilla oratoria TaxID=337810 RepID=UPI003F762FAA
MTKDGVEGVTGVSTHSLRETSVGCSPVSTTPHIASHLDKLNDPLAPVRLPLPNASLRGAFQERLSGPLASLQVSKTVSSNGTKDLKRLVTSQSKGGRSRVILSPGYKPSDLNARLNSPHSLSPKIACRHVSDKENNVLFNTSMASEEGFDDLWRSGANCHLDSLEFVGNSSSSCGSSSSSTSSSSGGYANNNNLEIWPLTSKSGSGSSNSSSSESDTVGHQWGDTHQSGQQPCGVWSASHHGSPHERPTRVTFTQHKSFGQQGHGISPKVSHCREKYIPHVQLHHHNIGQHDAMPHTQGPPSYSEHMNHNNHSDQHKNPQHHVHHLQQPYHGHTRQLSRTSIKYPQHHQGGQHDAVQNNEVEEQPHHQHHRWQDGSHQISQHHAQDLHSHQQHIEHQHSQHQQPHHPSQENSPSLNHSSRHMMHHSYQLPKSSQQSSSSGPWFSTSSPSIPHAFQQESTAADTSVLGMHSPHMSSHRSRQIGSFFPNLASSTCDWGPTSQSNLVPHRTSVSHSYPMCDWGPTSLCGSANEDQPCVQHLQDDGAACQKSHSCSMESRSCIPPISSSEPARTTLSSSLRSCTTANEVLEGVVKGESRGGVARKWGVVLKALGDKLVGWGRNDSSLHLPQKLSSSFRLSDQPSPSPPLNQDNMLPVPGVRTAFGPYRKKIVVAIYDYNPTEIGDLPLRKNEEYEVLQDAEENWWRMRNRNGEEGYAPSNYVKEKASLGLQQYDWYLGDATRQRAEFILKREEKEGCFVVRNSTTTTGMYTLSVYSKQPTPQVKHYHIKREGDLYYLSQSIKCRTIPDLIFKHKYNPGGLCTRLRSPPTHGRQPPTTAGISHDKWEIDPNELNLLEELGSGQFGVVRHGKLKCMDVAVKMMKEGTMSEEAFIEEAKVMTQLQHTNLVQLYGVCSRHRPIYIVTEYLRYGSLLLYLRQKEKHLITCSEQLLDMCLQVCEGMAYLEKQRFIHRDLAARNCLVGSQGVIKVGDFGLARYVVDDEYAGSGGAKFPIKWAAPEVLNYMRFSSKSDVWAFGVLMWEVFTCGRMPYGKLRNAEVVDRVQSGQVLERPTYCPETVYELMKLCWTHDVDRRPSFADMRCQIVEIQEA